MLQILLVLLKIVGVLLALVIGLILIVLAAPIRYTFQFHADENTPPGGQIRVTWLCCILYMKASYIKGIFDYRVRIFGCQILGNQKEFLDRKKKRSDRKRKKREEKKRKEKRREEQKRDEEKRKEQKNGQINEGEENRSPVPEQAGCIEEEDAPKMMERGSEPEKSAQSGKSGNENKTKNKNQEKKKEKKTARHRNLWVTFQDKIQAARTLWQEYHGEQLLDFAKQVIIKILRHVLPRRLRGHIRFGFDDPAVTGIVTGMAAILYPRYGEAFSLEPDFQEQCFEADCRGRGRIHPGFFLYIGVIILKNRDVRTFIRKLF